MRAAAQAPLAAGMPPPPARPPPGEPRPTGLRTVQLQVSGMRCASCVGRVEKALLAVPGVSTSSVNLATETATVQTQATGVQAGTKGSAQHGAEDSAQDGALLQALQRAGSDAQVAADNPGSPLPDRPAAPV